MKISTIKNKLALKNFVHIAFSHKIAESRFVFEKSGEEILEIKPQVKEKISRRQLVILARQIIFFAKKNGIKKIALNLEDILSFKPELSETEIGEILAVNFEMANYEFVKYKEKPKEGWKFIEEVAIIFSGEDRNFSASLKKGQLIGKEINASRDLANAPGGEMTPTLLAQEIKKATQGTKIKMKVLEVVDMKKLGMGGILGVASGSCEKPKFIIMEYEGKKEKNPLVLIGKAITFDTGGISLKPADYMTGMHMDMSGGAAVAHAIIAMAKLGIKKKIIGLIPAAENMPSGESYRPGDILKSMSGKTIEVLNTDAEGRIILADALTYAEKYQPELVIDVATLTGASAVALGERASAILSKNEEIIQKTREAGEESGDYVWPFPLWDEYENEIMGTNGDVANLKNKGDSRLGGVISGAMFLYQFAKKHKNWMHIDMGSRDSSVYDEFLSKGSAGAPIRLLIKLIEKY
ncbi:MAG: putative cytosol aminopeptidase [Candidatus Moranbacteria bacterium GW2011_GWF2_36_839]|nr:MAG: putative cytosol aminopeptidase [Candidatus Moranbacteria bacterium GW2011_GWF1_36_78]KKQ16398.1 MAG: putative cytosol aminopeptidase [Candidatus Moranbacteria bacterium GW2011_GWF2_36_839]HAT74341.1 leucyl aminopeptidase [Candidatus Moranbacteria bacterium]HBY11240.1 leucyl aminopeptidase [Candidatus Moranbacteria bacterium]